MRNKQFMPVSTLASKAKFNCANTRYGNIFEGELFSVDKQTSIS